MEKFGFVEKIRYSEMDYDLVLKPSALLQFLQDTASVNAENLGFGYSFVREHGLAWYLLKYRMEFDEYPKDLQEIKINTIPRGYNKIFAFRDFEIFSGDKMIGRVASTWALVGFQNDKGMANASEVLAGKPNMNQFEKLPDDLTYGKIRLPESFDIEKTFEIRFEDLDVNCHANNVNYIVWAFEPLGFEFRKTKILKALDIVFKKEITYGNSVLSQVKIEGNNTVHVLKNAQTDEDLCMISAEWTDKK